MDSFDRRNQARPRQAVDGFFGRPQAMQRSVHRLPAQRPAASQLRSSGRRVDDFSRADGFHTPSRRAVSASGPAGGRGRAAGPQQRTRFAETSIPAGLNLDLPDSGKSKKSKKAAVKHGKLRAFRRLVFRTTAVAMVLCLGVGGFLFYKGYLKLHKVFQGGSTAAALTSNIDPSLLKGEGDGRVNVLLMGIGGPQHDGGDLTDTLMVASVDPVNNQATLLSIPRDLWTKMPNNYISSYQKINAAYESGKYKYLGRQNQKNQDHKAIIAGFQGIDSTIERVTGVPIHYNMLVDFQAFSQAVDTVGGVTVNNPEKLWDPTMAWENGHNPLLAPAGINNFDGKHALIFVRSRETSSDFARSQRQRMVMMALKDKTENLGTLTNPLKLSSLLSAFGDNIQSDIGLGDMTRMASIMKKIPSNQIQSVGLADGTSSFVTTGNINGLSVVIPKAGLEDYSKIQQFIRSKLQDGYITREKANITILNGSGTSGLATTKSDELKSYGYTIGTVANAPTEEYSSTKIIDMSGGAKKYTLNYLKKRFNVQNVDTQLPPGIVAGQANIVIILGSDAASSTQI